ncbi:hypothetical protein PMAYCL1PPCAC_27871, partial [Pristionchus mayeri]
SGQMKSEGFSLIQEHHSIGPRLQDSVGEMKLEDDDSSLDIFQRTFSRSRIIDRINSKRVHLN